MDMMILVVDVTKGLQAQTLECIVIAEAVMERGSDVIVVLNKVCQLRSVTMTCMTGDTMRNTVIQMASCGNTIPGRRHSPLHDYQAPCAHPMAFKFDLAWGCTKNVPEKSSVFLCLSCSWGPSAAKLEVLKR